MGIGENIKKIRKEKKITQSDLAKQMGISRSYLGDLENNRYNPSSKTLEMLSEKLGISMLYLTTGEKSLGDVMDDDEELRKQFAESESSISNMIEDFKRNIQKDLSQLATKELSYMDAQLIYHLLHFINESDETDKQKLATFLYSLNRTVDIDSDEVDHDELLEEINAITNFIEKLLKNRSGYIEKSD